MTARSKGRSRSWVLSLLIMLAVLEGGMRVLLYVKGRWLDAGLPECTPYTTGRCRTPDYQAELAAVTRYDLLHGFGVVPDYTGELITTNALGFRGPELDPNFPAEGLRVVVIGGSFVWGSSVKDDQTIPAYLLRELSQALSDRPVEVINAGVTGDTSLQELIRLETTVLDVQPDVVVVLDGRNDLYYAVSPRYDSTLTPAMQDVQIHLDYLYGGDWRSVRQSLGRMMKQYSVFYRTVVLVLSNVRQRANSQAPVAVHPEVVSSYEANLRRMAGLLQAEGVTPVFVLQPTLGYQSKPLSPEERVIWERRGSYLDELLSLYPAAAAAHARVGQNEGVVAVDLGDIFTDTAEMMYQDDVHLTPAGNARVAQRLAEIIVPLVAHTSP